MKDNSVKDQFVELRAQGMSFASIADRLGTSKTTLIAWSKELDVDIANMRQIHLEAIREKCQIGVERRMELFAKQLDAVESELSKRTLENILTERLVSMAVKIGQELNALISPVVFQKRSNGFVIDFDPVTRWEA